MRGKFFDVSLPIDKIIPQIPIFIILYMCVYFVWAGPFFFVRDKKQFKYCVAAYLFVALLSTLIFILFPTRSYWPDVQPHGIWDYALLALRQSLEEPYNLIPSMHMSLAYLSSFIVAAKNKMAGYILATISTLIAFSTLFTKQHYIVDLIAGFALSLIVFLWLKPKLMIPNAKHALLSRKFKEFAPSQKSMAHKQGTQ